MSPTTTIKPEFIPLDLSTPLSPTYAFFITQTKHQTFILDLTPSLSSLFSPPSINLTAATNLATASPFPPTIYTLRKENLLGTHLSVKDGEGKDVAEWKSPILSLHMGRTTVTFHHDEREETVEIKPISVGRRSEVFVQDNVTYIWEVVPSHHEQKMLYKIIESESPSENGADSPVIKKVKREVARYEREKGYSKEGMLMLGGGG